MGISPPTAAQWLSVLEASGQLALLEPWFSNRTKRMAIICRCANAYPLDGGVEALPLGDVGRLIE